MKTYRTTKLIMQDAAGSMLLLQRSASHPTHSLQIDLPGGVIEAGEQPATALTREVQEETGIEVDETQLALLYAECEEYGSQNAVRLVYQVRLSETRPAVTVSWEHADFIWCSLTEASEKLTTADYKARAVAYVRDKHLLEDL